MAGYVVRMRKGRSAFKILTGKSRGKRTLGIEKLTVKCSEVPTM